jgi:hypothetical protein
MELNAVKRHTYTLEFELIWVMRVRKLRPKLIPRIDSRSWTRTWSPCASSCEPRCRCQKCFVSFFVQQQIFGADEHLRKKILFYLIQALLVLVTKYQREIKQNFLSKNTVLPFMVIKESSIFPFCREFYSFWQSYLSSRSHKS